MGARANLSRKHYRPGRCACGRAHYCQGLCHACWQEARPAGPADPGGRPCRHCGTRKANRPRGLCWRCYYTPGVKERYPSEGHRFRPAQYRDGSGDVNGGYGLAPGPTDAPVGSVAKLAVLAARAAARVSLWHPGDSKEREREQVLAYTPDPDEEGG